MTTYHHVERIIGYRAFFLMHIEGNPDMQWTADDNDAFRYDDLAEAEQDAEIYGGEVCTFQSGFADRPSTFLPSPVASLERCFSTQAAE